MNIELTKNPGIHSIFSEVHKLAGQRKAQGRNTIVGIAGGSCTGKTSYVARTLYQLSCPGALLLSQDNFQLGYALDLQTHDTYRWDDPDNYGLRESASLLKQLSQGLPGLMPCYSFSEKARQGYQRIIPKGIIFFEGLYACYGEVRPHVDLAVYVETPFYGRLLRRLFRNSRERYQAAPKDVLQRLLTGSVFRAHDIIVSRQRRHADLILPSPYHPAESIERFALQPYQLTGLIQDKVLHSAPDWHISLMKDNKGRFVFCLFVNGNCYLDVPVGPEAREVLLQTDFHRN